ncbi:MAG TPA: LacI family DNA-binding transcriptional regulator [Solirubrobacteraceae bacterium]|nr:LacI family DNA-binding transcriptional regulator [Solirubrobacteraceae bacterium]
MADVAKLAGVSHQTVSRVLNESERVSSETRERVLAAMTKLNYRPNPTARALASGRSKTVGVITLDTPLYGPTSALFGIERAAHDAGFFVSVASLRSLDMPSLISTADNLRRQNVAGILVIAPQREVAHALMHLQQDLPVVAVEAGPPEGVPVVAVQQYEGAAQATRHLLELGHETVWHIAGPGDWLEAADRVNGWREPLEAAGARVPKLLFGDWSARSGYELSVDLVRDPEVTAIFAANDAMALGVLRRIHEAGRDVPGSISVVGFDDVPEAAYYTPPLTTIRQDFIKLGRSSFGLLLDEIESGERPALHVTIPPKLIVRASTARVASSSAPVNQ